MRTPRLTPQGRTHLLAGLVLAVLVVSVYGNSLGNGFTYDDEILIVKNTLITDLRNLPVLVSPRYFVESTELSYRPLVTLTYFMDNALWGLRPFGFHLTNLLLHLATTLLVYALFLQLLPAPGYPRSGWGARHPEGGRPGEGKGEGPGWGAGPSWPALLGAALFAAHPVLTEAVDNVGYREDLLATGLVLLALWAFLRREESARPKRLTALGLTAYGLALLSKETAAAFPLLLLLCDWAQGRFRFTREGWRARLPLYGGVALVTAGYLSLRFGIMHFPGEDVWTYPPPTLGERLRTWPYATWLHVSLLVLPLNLSANYIFHAPPTLMDPMLLFPLALLTALGLGALWLAYRDQRVACLGLLWIVVALAPVANVIALRQPVAERYLYLPAVGWALLLAVALGRLRSRSLALGLTGLLLLTYSTLTIQRNPVWRDDFSLWHDTVQKMPTSPWAHNNLGVEYELRGDLERAVREYAWAAHLFPGYSTAHQSMGRVYMLQGRLALAAQQLRHALRANPRNPLILANLGVVYQRQGRPERALPLFRATLERDPQNAEVWANLGAALVALGRRGEALAALEEARRLNPSEAVIHNNLGNLYAEAGRWKEAIDAYQTALRLNPRLVGVHENLAAAYHRLGRHAEAQAEEAAAQRGRGPRSPR